MPDIVSNAELLLLHRSYGIIIHKYKINYNSEMSFFKQLFKKIVCSMLYLEETEHLFS